MAGDENQPLKPPDATPVRGDHSQEEALEDQAARLPVDVLAGVLCRVPPRWLAASRCVCRAWRDAVDGRRLLRADLLPLSLAGLFVHFDEHKFPEFLARPSSSAAGARTVSGDLSFLPSASPQCGYFWQEGCVDWRNYNIVDHCNGLLLLSSNCVVNPATRRWNTLPTCPAKNDTWDVRYRGHLVYDPMVSPYYEVFKIPALDGLYTMDKIDTSKEESEWPPSLLKIYVFSSKSGCWEERNFGRQGKAAGTVSEMRAQMRSGYVRFSGVYFRGAHYVHCRSNFIMKVSLSTNTYSVIKPPPMDLQVEGCLDINIERSEKGVYLVALDRYWPRNRCWLQVWILNESCASIEWVLKHDKDLKHMKPRRWCGKGVKWILEDSNYNLFRASSLPKVNMKANTEEKFEWNSDEDVEDEDMVDHGDMKAVVENKLAWNSNKDNGNYGGMVEDSYYDEDRSDDLCDEDIKILGFHPYKEIIFLSASERRCLAYHLNGLKFEELGNIYPKEYIYFKELSNEQEKIKSFPYTPCWMEEFPGNN